MSYPTTNRRNYRDQAAQRESAALAKPLRARHYAKLAAEAAKARAETDAKKEA